MRYLSWDEFDAAVEQIALLAEQRKVKSVAGMPRGGLPLAVALSHRLQIPVTGIWHGCLLVDDVYETGRTLEPYKNVVAMTAVWISKAEPTWWQAAEVTPSSDWIVFPWENKTKAKEDMEEYYASS